MGPLAAGLLEEEAFQKEEQRGPGVAESSEWEGRRNTGERGVETGPGGD